MPDNIERFYNRIYSEREDAYGEGNPEKFVEEVLKYLQTGTALELGSGEGRNALFLASQGFEVTAVDTSEVGVNKLQEKLKEKGLNAELIKADIRDLAWKSSIIYCCLHMSFIIYPKMMLIKLFSL